MPSLLRSTLSLAFVLCVISVIAMIFHTKSDDNRLKKLPILSIIIILYGELFRSN